MIKFKEGMRVSAKIGGTVITDGAIRVIGEQFYLLQNILAGGVPPAGDNYGYKNSWKFTCRDGVLTDQVTNIMLLMPTLETLDKGDVIQKGKTKYTVGGVAGDIYFLLDSVGYVDKTVTLAQLKSEKYKVIGPEPEEVTEEELFEELGRPVKIVKKKK